MEQQKQNTPKRWRANWATNETLKLVYRKMKQNVWLTFRKERAGKVKQADLYYSFSSGHIIANLDLHRHVNPERHFCIWGWLPHISLSSYCLAVLGTDPTKVPNISPRAGFWIQTSDSENAVQLSPNSCPISPLLPCLPRLFKWPKKPFLLRVSVTKVIVSPGGCLLPKAFSYRCSNLPFKLPLLCLAGTKHLCSSSLESHMQADDRCYCEPQPKMFSTVLSFPWNPGSVIKKHHVEFLLESLLSSCQKPAQSLKRRKKGKKKKKHPRSKTTNLHRSKKRIFV